MNGKIGHRRATSTGDASRNLKFPLLGGTKTDPGSSPVDVSDLTDRNAPTLKQIDNAAETVSHPSPTLVDVEAEQLTALLKHPSRLGRYWHNRQHLGQAVTRDGARQMWIQNRGILRGQQLPSLVNGVYYILGGSCMSGFITRRNAAKVAIAAWAGAAMLGYENANAKRAIDDAKPLANYSALRAYAGRASGVRITSAGIAGHFRRDVTDTTSSDNGGTIIVDARGDRWKRQVIGSWDAAWFGFSSARTSAENALALSALTAAAEIAKASVVVAKGTYLLPPQTSLKANDTEWHFEPGAVLKLHDTQATTSFLSFPAPVRQRVYGLTVDGNRAAQNATSFGADNSALIVVDARNCLFDSTKIISSPAKGFVLVSTKGGNTRDTTIREFVGNNCVAQVLLIDGNNRTGSFERIIVDGVQIGATSHGGLVVNDGAHDIAISNVNADVHNTTWDAVSIRDSHDLKLTNIHGKRGRNGVYLQRLNGLCGRIQMHNVTGEFSEQNGILFLGAEDVTGNKVGGRNNGSAGINIAAGAGGYRSRNIRITCAFGYDDQGVKTQKYGILVQAADNVTLENARVHDNISRNVSIVKAGTAHVDVELRQAVIASSGATKIEVEHASCE